MRRRLIGLAAAAAGIVAAAAPAVPVYAADPAYKVMVFSKTAGFRHSSIAKGIATVQALGAANNFTVTATEDAAAFTTANLAQFKAVVFLNTTGDVLTATQQTAFESYIGGGGGFVGVHSAADTEYNWTFYGELVGGYFASHPAIQQATVRVEDRAHAATAHLPQTWTRTDEWYNYQASPRSKARVLATLDESSYSGGSMGADHPITWCRSYGGGRSFYTGFGHTEATYDEAAFRTLLLGGIRYAAGWSRADCRPESGYTKLYNGSTTGWSQAGPGGFTNSDATLKSSGGLGLLWYSAKEFGSYSLKLDWKMDGDDNSGVFVGFPNPGSDPWVAANQGYEVQIDATDVASKTTGAVYDAKSADIAARDAALNPPGEWNTYELLVEGERLQVFLNGSKINDFTNTNPARSLASGYVGIQNHGTGDDVSFRNIRIKELAAPAGDTTIQGEAFSAQSGIGVVDHANAVGGKTVGNIGNGDWIAFSGVNLSAVTGATARVSSGGAGGTIEYRAGSATGTLLGSTPVPVTGGWETFRSVGATTATSSATTLYLVFKGGSGALFDVDQVTLNRGSTLQAESYATQSGVQVVNQAGAHNGQRVGYVNSGDWVGFSGVNLSGVTGLAARVSSAGAGGSIQVRAGSATGTLLGTLAVSSTGGWDTYAATATATLAASSATSLYLVFTGSGTGALFDVDDVILVRG
jgi:type 1 glutamine amidotransferase